jgi:hypothetical protein
MLRDPALERASVCAAWRAAMAASASKRAQKSGSAFMAISS